MYRFDAGANDSTEGQCRYPTGEQGVLAWGYPAPLVRSLPQGMVARFCGVGNVLAPAQIQEGEKVLDVGCGCGVDSALAALGCGPEGKVFGVDISPGMVAMARA